MADLRCAECGSEIGGDDVNIAADTAYCRACGHLSRPSELLADSDAGLDGVDVGDPPDGCEMRETLGGGIALRATARSVGGAVGAIAIALFWNGITGIFVAFNLAATLHFMGVPMPKGFVDGLDMEPWLCVGLWLFLTPFMLIGACMISIALLNLFGHVAVTVAPGSGRIFTGVGPIGWRRRFEPSQVKRVTLGKAAWQQNERDVPAIELDLSGGRMRFGTSLTPDRRAWLIAALRVGLDEVDSTAPSDSPRSGPFGGQSGWS